MQSGMKVRAHMLPFDIDTREGGAQCQLRISSSSLSALNPTLCHCLQRNTPVDRRRTAFVCISFTRWTMLYSAPLF